MEMPPPPVGLKRGVPVAVGGVVKIGGKVVIVGGVVVVGGVVTRGGGLSVTEISGTGEELFKSGKVVDPFGGLVPNCWSKVAAELAPLGVSVGNF